LWHWILDGEFGPLVRIGFATDINEEVLAIARSKFVDSQKALVFGLGRQSLA